jgi:hypothetical protein
MHLTQCLMLSEKCRVKNSEEKKCDNNNKGWTDSGGNVETIRCSVYSIDRLELNWSDSDCPHLIRRVILKNTIWIRLSWRRLLATVNITAVAYHNVLTCLHNLVIELSTHINQTVRSYWHVRFALDTTCPKRLQIGALIRHSSAAIVISARYINEIRRTTRILVILRTICCLGTHSLGSAAIETSSGPRCLQNENECRKSKNQRANHCFYVLTREDMVMSLTNKTVVKTMEL